MRHSRLLRLLSILWPYRQDTMEPFMAAMALGGSIGSILKGDANFTAMLIFGMSYLVGMAVRLTARR